MDFAKDTATNHPGLVIGGGALLQGGLSFLAASEQNKAIHTSLDAAYAAAQLQRQDAAMQTGQQIDQRRSAAGQVEGRIRAAFGEAGQGTSGSAAAVANQNLFDAGTDTFTSLANYGRAVRGIDSNYNATVSDLEAQSQSLLGAFLRGAGSGALQSLSLIGALA